MLSKQIDDIRTSELISKAGVSRTSFYRKYRNKYDFLNQSYQKILDVTLDQIPEGASYKTSFFRLYQVLAANAGFFSNALSSNEPDGLKAYIGKTSVVRFRKMFREQGMDVDDPDFMLKLYGYVYGTLEVTCVWVRDQIQSVEDLFKISLELMPSDFQMCLAVYYL